MYGAQSLASKCLCNPAWFDQNQIILLNSFWFPSCHAHPCFCLVPWGPITRNALPALLRAALFRGSLWAGLQGSLPSNCALSPFYLPQPFFLCHTFLWHEGLCPLELCPQLRQSVLSCSYIGARINVPRGHRLLLPCHFVMMST